MIRAHVEVVKNIKIVMEDNSFCGNIKNKYTD